MTRVFRNMSLKTLAAAGAGLVALAFLASAAVAHGTGSRDGTGGSGGNPPVTQPAPGMSQGGMMGGAMGQGMTGQQRMPCVGQGQQTTGPCGGQGTGQMPGQTPGQTPNGQAPMMEQQIPPLRQ